MEKGYGKFLRNVEPLKSSLVAYCTRALWAPSEVEDVLQTALTTALETFAQFVEDTNFRAWIFKHLHDAIWNANRRHQLRRKSGQGDRRVETSASEILEQEWVYHELLERPEALYESFDQRVSRALLGLPDPEREVFLLRAIGELTYREIAEILAVPIGTVMGQLSRARGKLRESLVAYAKEAGWERLRGNQS